MKPKIRIIVTSLAAIALGIAFGVVVPGCQSDVHKAQAQNQTLQDKADATRANEQAVANLVAAARQKLATVGTSMHQWWASFVAIPAGQKGNVAPPPVEDWQAGVKDADNDLARTDKPLAQNGANLDAVKAAGNQLQKGVEHKDQQLKKEQDHWLGYKSRVLLWSVGGMLALGFVLYFLITGGAGPMLALGGVALAFVKTWGVRLVHVLTLGITHAATTVRAKLAANAATESTNTTKGA